jgi:hypothetical protein
VYEEQGPTWITGQVDDIAASRLAELDSLRHARDGVRSEVCQQWHLAEVPEDTLGVRHE